MASATHGAVRALLLLILPGIATTTAVGIAQGLDYSLGASGPGALFSLDPHQRARLSGWLESEGTWLIPSWLISAGAVGVLVGIAFPHWRVWRWVLGVGAATLALLVLTPPIAACSDYAYRGTPFLAAWEKQLPGKRDLILTLPVVAGGVAISAAAMPAGLRVGRRLSSRGLRSRRLRKARARRRQG